MPICRFQLHATESRTTRLGWVDLEHERVFELNTTLGSLLSMDADQRLQRLANLRRQAIASYPLNLVVLRAPVDEQEVWAAEATYERSPNAEADDSDIYERAYDGGRPQLFFKASGWRCVGNGQAIGIRADSNWDVPEPELVVVVDSVGEIAGYTIGNDVSSRSIEGDNALYLPQAKIYYASCAIGPWIVLSEEMPEIESQRIAMTIERDGKEIWSGETNTSKVRRKPEELISHLYQALDFPGGVLLMTGAGLAPPEGYSLSTGDEVTIRIEGVGTLKNRAIRLEDRSPKRGASWQ